MNTIFGLLRKFKGYRTVSVAVIVGVVGILQTMGIGLDKDVVMGIVDALFALVIAVLRLDTNTEVFKKE